MVGGSNPSGPTAPSAARTWSWRHVAVSAAGLAIAVLAVGALRQMAREVTVADIVAALGGIAPATVAAAVALTALSYLILTGYDWLALGHLGYRLPPRDVATASFASFTISHALGLTALTGGSVRLRLYSRAGVRPADVVLVIALCGWTFWLGIVVAAGIGLTLRPEIGAGVVPAAIDQWFGAALLAGAFGYLVVASLYRREMKAFGLRMKLPGFGLTLAQLAVGALDLAAAAGALYVLLPAGGVPPFPLFVAVYAVAMIGGAISHAPGGLGVFETIVVALLPGAGHGGVLAALLVFRLLYTLIPFVLGVALLARTELGVVRRRRRAAAAP